MGVVPDSSMSVVLERFLKLADESIMADYRYNIFSDSCHILQLFSQMSQSSRLVLENAAVAVELCKKSHSVNVLAPASCPNFQNRQEGSSQPKQKRDREDLVSVLKSGDRRIFFWLSELAKSGVHVKIEILDIAVFLGFNLFDSHRD